MLVLALALAAATAVAAPAPGPVCDAVWHDAARDRDVPVRIRLPAGASPVPLVLFSHGLGGDTGGGTTWARAWAARGLAVIHVQHPGSDSAVYRDARGPDDLKARVRAAATGVQLQARVADVGFVLDEVQRRRPDDDGACDLRRLDLARVGIAGHSMGAWTAQAVAGQNFYGAPRLADRRFKAAIAFSPSAPMVGSAAEAFAGVSLPFLSVTGSRDGNPLSADAAQRASAEAQRTGPFTAMPPGDKYLIVFDDGDHMAFAGNSRRVPTPTDLHIQAAASELTTRFWAAYLLGDSAAKAALQRQQAGAAPLAAADRFVAK
jgi:predicted dienelactone hydrolase